MAMKKTMKFLTLLASISLMGLACEATQAPNGSNKPLSPACQRECHSQRCVGKSVNKRMACTQCCDKKHKNLTHHKACINGCNKIDR